MLLKLATMACFCYLRPIDSTLNPQGPLSHSVPSVVIREVNREVKKAETRTKKRGYYLSFTAEEKAQVAKYGSTSEVRAAVKRCLSVCLYRRGSLTRDSKAKHSILIKLELRTTYVHVRT